MTTTEKKSVFDSYDLPKLASIFFSANTIGSSQPDAKLFILQTILTKENYFLNKEDLLFPAIIEVIGDTDTPECFRAIAGLPRPLSDGLVLSQKVGAFIELLKKWIDGTDERYNYFISDFLELFGGLEKGELFKLFYSPSDPSDIFQDVLKKAVFRQIDCLVTKMDTSVPLKVWEAASCHVHNYLRNEGKQKDFRDRFYKAYAEMTKKQVEAQKEKGNSQKETALSRHIAFERKQFFKFGNFGEDTYRKEISYFSKQQKVEALNFVKGQVKDFETADQWRNFLVRLGDEHKVDLSEMICWANEKMLELAKKPEQ